MANLKIDDGGIPTEDLLCRSDNWATTTAPN